MTELEETIHRIHNDNISVIEYDFEKLQGMVVEEGKTYYIGIKSSLNDCEKRFVCEHEYSHILTNSLYYVESSYMTKLRRETKANDNMIERLGLVEQMLPLLKEKYSSHEIEIELNVPNYIVWLVVNYMKRKRII